MVLYHEQTQINSEHGFYKRKETMINRLVKLEYLIAPSMVSINKAILHLQLAGYCSRRN